MAYKLAWADETQTTIIHCYYERLSIEEFYSIIDENAKMLSMVDHTVDVVVDITTLQTDMKGFLSAASYTDRKTPENQGVVVVVGANRFIKSIVGVAIKIVTKSPTLYFVDTLQEAQGIITEHRQ